MKFSKALIAAFVGCLLAIGGVVYLAPQSHANLKAVTAPSGLQNAASVAITGGTIDLTSSGSGFADGTVGSPSIPFASDNDGTGSGFYRAAANSPAVSVNGVGVLRWVATFGGISTQRGIETSFGGGAGSSEIATATNGIQYSALAGSVAAGAATSRTEFNKSVASIADATPTAVLTITIPNAAHSASVLVRVTGSLGAGGAIGANEATASNTYIVTLTRTAGVNATAAISSAFGSAATAVAGAATVTATAAMSAVSGAVGATNTFTVNVTITRSGGSSTNHTCLVYAQLMNANATGVTLS